ncbi:uncharacterized protein LOC129587159 isoform X3 [Paramacrobiotus metropolitanus]|uniref:uncharacterized protein LOC129587159 isoform X3 n=1 Tax=Paramacrobiotus metropolitanus TaxID=2943436 RepID=UPI0024459D84|nr:uncharacterized protein LOC129587159 isoform X3 [Paramacrobiotus metropolitanus]
MTEPIYICEQHMLQDTGGRLFPSDLNLRHVLCVGVASGCLVRCGPLRCDDQCEQTGCMLAAGFHLISDSTLLPRSAIMSTRSTVGYGDISPKSTLVQMLCIMFIVEHWRHLLLLYQKFTKSSAICKSLRNHTYRRGARST